jgi:hypothetical protein
MARIPDCELRRMHADGDPTGSRIYIVPGQCALALFVEPSVWRQRKRMRGYDDARLEMRPRTERCVAAQN